MEKEKEEKEKIFFYQNCSYRNRNGTNKMIVNGDQCIFGGTIELYHIEIKKTFIPREKIFTTSISNKALIAI